MKKKTYEATMWLPKDGKKYWSSIMYGEAEFSYDLYENDIIVAAYTQFEDGTQVIGGVRKSDSEDYNIKFFTVLAANGTAYPDWPIDTGDHEDFEQSGYLFILNDDETIEYHLTVSERAA